MSKGLNLDALREQAAFVVHFDLYDVPKRLVSMVFGAACLAHFASLQLAMIPVVFILTFEAIGRIMNMRFPASVDDVSPTLIALIYLRVVGSVVGFCLITILLVQQTSEMAMAIGLLLLGGVTVHSLSSHALMSVLNWLVVATISANFIVVMVIIPQQVYSPPGPGDLTVFYACSVVWIANLITTTLRQGSTRKIYAEAITVAKERARDLDFLARHDALTGLLNRRAFDEMLLDAIQFAKPHAPIALLAIDLDGFKPINDTFGHAAGDAALVEVSQRIISVVGADNAARLGGDEFAVLFRLTQGRIAVRQSAVALKTLLSRPFEFDGQTIELGASVGVTFSERAGDDADSLAARADRAMYHAKTRKLDNPVFSEDITVAS